jgi:hypothetical protein
MNETIRIESDKEMQSANSAKAEKVNILLVDDQPGKLLAHEAILEELGQNIVKATSGREALECLLRQDFAVILLDVCMPEIDGFETAELIRGRPRFEKTPIIFVTAYNTSDLDRLKGYGLGAVDYLFLPIIPEVLKAKVHVFVELARQTKLILRQAENLARHNEAQTQQLETIQKLNLDLKEANQELEAFSYSVSHDLRAPLRALKGYTDILLEDYGPKLDGPAKGYLSNLNRAVVRMDALTRDLLNYSHIVRQHIELESVNVDMVWRDVTAMIPSLQPPNTEIVVSPNLLPVRAHPTLLGQCLANLLDNAAKFVAPGVTPRIHIHTEPRDDRVLIWLEDNGIGIDPAHHQKIFGIFERIGNLKDNQGTGIGLAIVARAVQRMGGRCGVESSPGNGSRFWIELAAA